MFRSGLQRILNEEFPDAVIEESSSCSGVLEKAQKDSWDVIILDISMGAQNSLSIVPDLKKQHPRTPILMLSMYSDKQFIVQSLRAGASGYLTKEHTTEELIHGIKAVLAGRRYLSESIAENLADYMAIGGCEFPHEFLSAREYEVFILIAKGRAVSEIGAMLSLSTKTVSTYRTRILEKMSLRSNGELMRYALQHGLVK
ncbi:response regulator transcription factor [bacterium]|nr:response regulator transcription factor [bacterium]MBP9807068.1 response regulator transcription factor [bacterium]